MIGKFREMASLEIVLQIPAPAKPTVIVHDETIRIRELFRFSRPRRNLVVVSLNGAFDMASQEHRVIVICPCVSAGFYTSGKCFEDSAADKFVGRFILFGCE